MMQLLERFVVAAERIAFAMQEQNDVSKESMALRHREVKTCEGVKEAVEAMVDRRPDTTIPSEGITVRPNETVTSGGITVTLEDYTDGPKVGDDVTLTVTDGPIDTSDFQPGMAVYVDEAGKIVEANVTTSTSGGVDIKGDKLMRDGEDVTEAFTEKEMTRDEIKKALSPYGEYNGRCGTPALLKALELCRAGSACPICIGTGSQVQGGKCKACGGSGKIADAPQQEPEAVTTGDLTTPSTVYTLDEVKVKCMTILRLDGYDAMMEPVRTVGGAAGLLEVDPAKYPALMARVEEILDGRV